MMLSGLGELHPGLHLGLHLWRPSFRCKADITMWMAPGTEPMKNAADSEAKWIMDGRYLEWTHTGDFEGMPFRGRAIEARSSMSSMNRPACSMASRRVASV